MRAGLLKHPIEIHEYSEAADSHGTLEKTWSKLADDRAAIWPQKTKEVVLNEKIEFVNIFIFEIRYRAGLTTHMRIKDSGDTWYKILGIRNVNNEDKKLQITCQEEL